MAASLKLLPSSTVRWRGRRYLIVDYESLDAITLRDSRDAFPDDDLLWRIEWIGGVDRIARARLLCGCGGGPWIFHFAAEFCAIAQSAAFSGHLFYPPGFET
jgi:hypothetical protein